MGTIRYIDPAASWSLWLALLADRLMAGSDRQAEECIIEFVGTWQASLWIVLLVNRTQRAEIDQPAILRQTILRSGIDGRTVSGPLVVEPQDYFSPGRHTSHCGCATLFTRNHSIDHMIVGYHNVWSEQETGAEYHAAISSNLDTANLCLYLTQQCAPFHYIEETVRGFDDPLQLRLRRRVIGDQPKFLRKGEERWIARIRLPGGPQQIDGPPFSLRSADEREDNFLQAGGD